MFIEPAHGKCERRCQNTCWKFNNKNRASNNFYSNLSDAGWTVSLQHSTIFIKGRHFWQCWRLQLIIERLTISHSMFASTECPFTTPNTGGGARAVWITSFSIFGNFIIVQLFISTVEGECRTSNRPTFYTRRNVNSNYIQTHMPLTNEQRANI
jgi:hypothetical protein